VKDKLLKSSAHRVIEIVTNIVISLALTPYLIQHLGNENYGLWILILSTLGWFNFIDLGFSYAVQRNIALALEKSDNNKINIIFSVSVALFSMLGAIAAGLVLVLALFPELLGINEINQTTAAIVLSILAIKVLFDFIMNSFHGFYTAYLRMDIDANLSTINIIVKSILVYVLIIDLNIYGAVIATIAADILTHSLKIYFVKRLHPQFKFKLGFVQFNEIKKLFEYSKHLIINDVATSINRGIDPVIISHVLGLKVVALYSVVNSLINQIEALVQAIVGVFQPMVTKLVASNKITDDIFKSIVRINFFVVILLYTPLAILAENFISLWIGEEYIKAADLATILGFAYICKSISRPINNLLLAQANHKLLSAINLTSAILNIILSLWLVTFLGVEGIAIATGVSFFVTDVLLHLALLKRYTKIPILPILMQLLILLITYVTIVMLGKGIMAYFTPLSWLQLFLSAGIIVIILFVFAWYLVLNTYIRQRLMKTILKKAL